MPAFFRSVDLLVSEGTFGDDSQVDRAIERKHMTFREAATLARDSEAGALWLTHFSPSLERPAEFLENARAVFPRTVLGKDHLQMTLRFDQGSD
jgi:ribonuclease Z